METLRWHSDGEIDPVTKIKGVRKFELRDVALIREAWLWRDEVARARDRAPFRVAGDPALLEIVRERPRDVSALARIHGFSPQLAERAGRELLDRLERTDGLDDSELVGYPSGPSGPRRAPPGPARSLRGAQCALHVTTMWVSKDLSVSPLGVSNWQRPK